jgi:hypothetical protein
MSFVGLDDALINTGTSARARAKSRNPANDALNVQTPHRAAALFIRHTIISSLSRVMNRDVSSDTAALYTVYTAVTRSLFRNVQ